MDLSVLVDYHVHGLGHQTRQHTLAELTPFVVQGLQQGLSEIGFAEHDAYIEDLDFSNFQHLQRQFPKIRIKIGLEVDFWPEQEKRYRQLREIYSWDYLIGSVHYLGDWGFDHPDYTERYREWDIDALYRTYYGVLTQMIQSQSFDLVGHLDLIKIFGYRPHSSGLKLAGPTLAAIREAGMTVEINTAGWYKPVEEVYPAPDLLEACFQMGIPITFSSDAHRSEDTGRDIIRARELAWKVGYRQVATYVQRKRIMQPL